MVKMLQTQPSISTFQLKICCVTFHDCYFAFLLFVVILFVTSYNSWFRWEKHLLTDGTWICSDPVNS